MNLEELQSIGSGDDRSRQSSLASLADDLTKRSTFNHRLGLGLDRALANLHPQATAATTATDSNDQFLSTAAAVATGTASGFGSFRVPIQTEESKKKLSSLAESAGGDGDAEDDAADAWDQAASTAAAAPAAPVVSDAPMVQVIGQIDQI